MKKIALFSMFAALVSFSSCEEENIVEAIKGCTDVTADNYMADATEDDGSCTYTIEGCTDATASNYNASATVDNGSCTYAADLYAGTYAVAEACTGGEYTYDQEITVNGNEITLINAFGWSAGTQNDLTIAITGNSFSATGLETIIEGNGNEFPGAFDLDAELAGNVLTISYTLYLDTDGSGLAVYDECVATCTLGGGKATFTSSKKYLNL